MMNIQEKILDAYQLFLLCDRNVSKTLQLTKITRPTLLKYIKIQECLDYSLLEYLDKKGKEKLKIGDAIYLCDHVLNPEQQHRIFQFYLNAPKKERIQILNDKTTCDICMDNCIHFEYTPCCQKPICQSCLTRTFESCIQDIIFKPVQCPFCNESYDLHYVRWLLKSDKFCRVNSDIPLSTEDLWRKTKIYQKNKVFNTIYTTNLYNKYISMIDRIERKQDYVVQDDKPNFKELLGDELYFGSCSECTPAVINHGLIGRREWRRLEICDIPKQCGNGEGGILVLEPEMFRCVICKSKDENYEDGEFKKCPHCGIKTVKPDGCNFIYCGDHRWCWICNERIENNEDGHNKHYWTGPGTSPYSNQCRQSINFNASKFLIRGKCDCSSCKNFGGSPLCQTMDCMNRTEIIENSDEFHKYCNDCRRD